MAIWHGAPILLTVDGDTLPTEFRLFTSGVNRTRKGEFLFDEVAAAAVMAAYHEHGADLMIDLEHLSVAPEEVSGDGRNFDPDARGWCKLALRNGELWAVQVTWTPEGAERLRARRQRYVSPAFHTDADRRVASMINVAITALPATDHTPALVASNRGRKTMDPKRLCIELDTLLRAGKSHGEAMTLLGLDIKTVQSVVKAMGGDPAADLATLLGTVQAFAQALAEAAAGKVDEPVEEPAALAEGEEDPDAMLADGDPIDDKDPEAAAAMTRQLCALTGKSTVSEALAAVGGFRRIALDHQKHAAKLAADRKVLEGIERTGLVRKLVTLGRETPATAWSDMAATQPKGVLATMPLDELRDRVRAFGGAPATLSGAPVPAKSSGVTINPGFEVSDFELARVKRVLATQAKRTDFEGQLPTEEEATARYIEIKGQQIAGAEKKGDRRLGLMLSRPLEVEDVILNANGRLDRANAVTLSTPVKPIEEFGATSQRALEEFRLEYMAVLSSLPHVWAETIGDVIAGGLKDTYPIDFAVSKYQKKIAESAAARTSNVKEVSVSKDLYHEAEQCELYRLQQGDFAYIRSWDAKAGRMARARQHLRNQLVTTLLEANGDWVDGVAFFAATHKVDPFNAAREFRGSATWSNLQASAAPLDADALTTEKNALLYSTPGPDGEEMGYEADGMLIPTILNQTAKDLLTVQDLIMDATGTAGIRNPHFNSGMRYTRGSQLAGTGSTANWYLLSHAGIASGLVPWVISEDPNEEVRTWDESSDFYKNGTGFIKLESLVRLSVALLYPHAIRKINGT